jgi:predicted O-methyltransferase YrrM
MDAARRELLEQLYRDSREHDAALEDRVQRFRNVEPESAELLAVLIRATQAERLLEIGTSNGYSTIWLADAAEATGGELVSVEVDAERTALARENLERAGLGAELRTEDAATTLSQAEDAAYGFVFLDAERPAYASYWPDLVRTLAPGGLLVVDNVLSHEDQLIEFTALVEADGRVTSTVVPVGAGLRLAVREP